MTAPARQPQGIPAGGQFAPDTRAEPELTLGPPANRFARFEDVRELDAAANTALRPLLASDAVEGDEAAANEVRNEWIQRRTEIFAARRRREFSDYAARLEDQASDLLTAAARANLRNVADELRAKYPQASTIVLDRDYDDGNLAVYVKSVQGPDGAGLDENVLDTAQELISEHSSRQLARFVDESPIDLASAAAWEPAGRPGLLH